MSHTISHQDYTVRHVTQCQYGLSRQTCLSVLTGITLLDMPCTIGLTGETYAVGHAIDYGPVQHATSCRPGLTLTHDARILRVATDGRGAPGTVQ